MADTVPIKILLIEDDPLMYRMYQRVFKYEGFDMQLAENGKVGLAKLAEYRPDVILLDVMMPVMDGKSTLVVLKSNPDTKDIPVIVLTNLNDPKTEQELLKQGAVQYVRKSNDGPAEVASLVRSVLKNSKPKE